MKQDILFEIYEGEGRNGKPKKYIVTDFSKKRSEVLKYCKRLFRCSEQHIDLRPGWIYKNELYLDRPHKGGEKLVAVGYYVR